MKIADEFIIECARRIAQNQAYPVLINGLQPLDDYEVGGKAYPGLQTKYEREFLELREAFASWQSGQGKTKWHVLHEGADVYYYTRQREAQSERSLWPAVYGSVRIYLPTEWTDREVRAAAHAKYGWRSEQPGNKDEEHEIMLMQQAVRALPAKRGRKEKRTEPMTRLNFVLSKRLRDALQRAWEGEYDAEPDISLSEIAERQLLQDEYIKQFLQ